MSLPEDILSERIGQYQRRTQFAIDGERPVAFIGYVNPDGSGEGNWVEGKHDSFDRLMAAHRCEHCTGSLDRESEQEIEEGTVAGVILAFAVLVLCGVAFVLWMFWAAAAQP